MKDIINKTQLRKFGFVFGLGLPIIVGLFFPLIYGMTFQYWTLWAGITTIVIGIVKPSLLKYPYKLWMVIGLALGKINSRIILGLIFLLVLQPIAIVMKIFGYDPLKLKISKLNSYRENNKNHTIDLEKIF